MMHDRNTKTPALANCSMNAVRDLCLTHKLQQTIDNTHLLKNHAGTLGNPRSFPAISRKERIHKWLAATTQPQFGEPSQPVFEALLQITGCMYGPNGFDCLPKRISIM